ncbi:MAG: hypothetical protein K6G47_06000 [Clostridia bacterium]|nr:hypothetical protein [Clostridia bacterium]
MSGSYLYACICEGTAERVIINKLLDEERLVFNRKDLLDREVLRCRSPRDFERQYLGKKFSQKIKVFRIQDSRREAFNLKAAYKDKVEVINVITAPEIEVLVIICEKKVKDFNKCKSYMKPSEYCKTVLKISDVKKEDFLKEYFSDTNRLIFAIKEYKKLFKVQRNESCLADILK